MKEDNNNGVNNNMNNGVNPNVNSNMNNTNNNVNYNINNEFSVDFNKDELKQQTKDTFDQVKNTFKNTDFQSGANEAKGFIKNFISRPISTMDEVIDNKVNYFSTAIILIVCFIATAAADYILDCLLSTYSRDIYLKSLVLYIISPIVYILAFTISTYLFMGKNKKSIPTIITGFSISCVSYILINVVDMVNRVVSKALDIDFIFRMFTGALRFGAYALMFYFITELVKSEEGKDKGFRKTIVIVFVAYAIIFIAQRLKIYSGI